MGLHTEWSYIGTVLYDGLISELYCTMV